MKFTLDCAMEDRWVPHFLAMLAYMEKCGQIGSSRFVTFYADGDGDFHPTFEIEGKLHKLEEISEDMPKPKETKDMECYFGEGDLFYDAG